MILLGWLDVTTMPLIMLFSALFAFQGAMYCTYPSLIYVLGVIVTAQWPAHVTANVILSLNRCLVVAVPELAKTLFAGRRTYAWFIAPLVAGVANSVFFKPLMYNGLVFAYVSDPHLGYFNDYGQRYANQFHFTITLFGAAALPLIYGVFVAALAAKAGGLKRLRSHSQYGSFIQVAVLASFTVATNFVYVYMQFYPTPPIICMLSTFTWFCIHGSPAVIYLTLNRSLRAALMPRSMARSTVAATTAQPFPRNGGCKQ